MAPEARTSSCGDWAFPDDPDADALFVSAEDEPEEGRVKQTFEKLMDGKDKEWSAVVQKEGPLRLLDLPVDILKEIVKEVTPTNDLTSLAQTCSAMHALSVPHIYSRFDIVWPDTNSNQEPRNGVDALTFGLSTLVMGEDVFGKDELDNEDEKKPTPCSHCGHVSPPRPSSPRPRMRRRGNNYAKFTKKFSLGNGPVEWVRAYTMHKEGGKMLGTLVALAVARMWTLESFVWDMPTGVIRDVWLALSSLSDRDDGQPCRLNRLHVRWHDNRPDPDDSRPSPDSPLFEHVSLLNENSKSRVESPTLSIVPSVKSLSVLDIDELAYLDEMSILIAKSAPKLRELRVSVSRNTKHRDWYAPWEAPRGPLYNNAQDYPRQPNGRRMGGILGTVFGHFLSEQYSSDWEIRPSPKDAQLATSSSQKPQVTGQNTGSKPAKARFVEDLPHSAGDASQDNIERIQRRAHAAISQPSTYSPESGLSRLPLEVLELQNIPISTRVLGRALDWRILTELTLLDCPWSDVLWKLLRQQFSPKGPENSRTPGSFSPNSTDVVHRESYSLALRKIHCDTVSTSLLSFLKETLAPNSLEVLFLQAPWSRPPAAVTTEQIIKGPLRRHRTSLKKIVVDSTWKGNDGRLVGQRWPNVWIMKRDEVAFLVNRKFENLKELCICIDHKDWHFMMQRLPVVSQLRSLFIPYVVDMKTNKLEPRELALQIVDIVTLCPEMDLSYLGIGDKCFEILDSSTAATHADDFDEDLEGPVAVRSDSEPLDDEGGDEDDDDDGDEDDLDGGGGGPVDDDEQEDEDFDGTDDSASEANESENEDENHKTTPKLREILFYDDKVAIFKARHRKL